MYRSFAVLGMALLAGFLLGAPSQGEESHEDLTLLFVQTARDVALEGDTLTLKGVGKATLFFSDRPERVAGHMDNQAFVDSWGEGADSFASDPPNGTLSVLSDEDVQNVVVELSQPKLVGDDLSYTVKVINGKMPAKAGPSSLFIDIIGMPLTPLSYAGVARRAYRRRIVFGGAAMAAAAGVAAAPPSTTVVVQQPAAAKPSGDSTVQKMQELQDMYDQGLINEAEYNQKKQALLNDM